MDVSRVFTSGGETWIDNSNPGVLLNSRETQNSLWQAIPDDAALWSSRFQVAFPEVQVNVRELTKERFVREVALRHNPELFTLIKLIQPQVELPYDTTNPLECHSDLVGYLTDAYDSMHRAGLLNAATPINLEVEHCEALATVMISWLTRDEGHFEIPADVNLKDRPLFVGALSLAIESYSYDHPGGVTLSLINQALTKEEITPLLNQIKEGRITEMAIGGNPLGDEGFQSLLDAASSDSSRLFKLGMANTGVTEASLNPLTVWFETHALSLDLSGNGLTQGNRDFGFSFVDF